MPIPSCSSSTSPSARKLARTIGDTSRSPDSEREEKLHNVRKELKLDANERWNEALKHMRGEVGYNGAMEGKNDPRSRWSRAGLYAHELTEGDAVPSDSDSDSSSGSGGEDDEPAWTKYLEEMHYLEMIDPKHRYGSNLKYYHRRWQEEDTEDNFFKWLDRGAGHTLSLPECPRQHLESATIRYLTPEQRFHYLVEVDGDGRLRWAHNREYVDTSPRRWEDTGEGRGVVPVDSGDAGEGDEDASSPASVHSPDPSSPAPHNADNPTSTTDTLRQKLSDHFTGSLTAHLLRKTLLRHRPPQQTWIYVSSLHYDLYVGIKDTGSFQHSSFLAGGLITSAGTIVVREGVVQGLMPLSGHYRTSMEHFKAFVAQMERRGADLSKVSISKAVAALWGAKQTKKAQRVKSNLAHIPRDGIRSLASVMCMTPLHLSGDDERQAKRREALYGRPPSDKAGKSLESVVETDEEPEEHRPAFLH